MARGKPIHRPARAILEAPVDDWIHVQAPSDHKELTYQDVGEQTSGCCVPKYYW